MGKKAPVQEEEGGEAVPLWYVSFADMITLLLSFFVMLSTFSSYDNESRTKFAGACQAITAYSVFPNRQVPRESLLNIVERQVDFTETGSEKAHIITDADIKNRPKDDWRSEKEAYARHKTLFIPLADLEPGGDLSDSGKAYLKKLADFMKAVPCQINISQPPNGEPLSDRISSAARGQRAWQVVEYLIEQEKLPSDRLSVSTPPAAQANALAGRAIFQMTLQTDGVMK